MSKPAILIRKSTGEVLQRKPYPREDMGEIIGLDPDLEWLIEHTPYEQPDYDSRIFVLNQTEEVTQEPHPEHAHLNQYKITYNTTKRTDEEIITHIENAEIEANEQLVDYRTRTKVFMLAIGVLIRRLDNLDTNPKEQAVLDNALASAVKIWKNDAQLKAKIKQLADGEEPDIDSQWEKE